MWRRGRRRRLVEAAKYSHKNIKEYLFKNRRPLELLEREHFLMCLSEIIVIYVSFTTAEREEEEENNGRSIYFPQIIFLSNDAIFYREQHKSAYKNAIISSLLI